MKEIKVEFMDYNNRVVTFSTTLDGAEFENVARAFYYAALAVGFHPDTVKQYIDLE